MVSGLVTSPEDQDRICLDDASPMEMASKLLMSITIPLLLDVPGVLPDAALGRLPAVALGLDLLLGLVRGLAVGGSHPGEVDAQLLRRAQEVVVLVAHLDAAALLRADVH